MNRQVQVVGSAVMAFRQICVVLPKARDASSSGGNCYRRAIFFVFQGRWLFGFLAFVAFTWVFVAFVAFHFASSAFTVPLFSHPLHCQFRCGRWLFGAFWLFGFWRLSGFGFSHPDAFPVGFLHPQHRKFLFSPPLNHHFFDHHATATF